MEYRQLGRSGLKVSVLTMGTMTMGGKGLFAKVGNVGLAEARRLIDLCIDAGVNLIDTADVYSAGASEEIVGEALGGKRKGGVLIATKVRFPMGDGPNDRGLSRYHIVNECEASLKRLKTERPLVFERGKGIFIFDETGKDYIESVSCFYCVSLGFPSG